MFIHNKKWVLWMSFIILNVGDTTDPEYPMFQSGKPPSEFRTTCTGRPISNYNEH